MSYEKDPAIEEIKSEVVHNDFIFPEASDETIEFEAHAIANRFSNWAEIVDNNAVTLSSKGATQEMHIGSLIVEDCNEVDVRYVIQIGYNGGTNIIARHRFMAADTKKLPGLQRLDIHALHIPIGQTIVYRMMCETGWATCEVMFAYHLQ